MSIFMLILGLLIGFAGKFGADKYHEFKIQEQKTISKMEDILTDFKAIEKIKEMEKDPKPDIVHARPI